MRPRPDPTPSRDAASHANPPPRPAARRLLLRALQDTEVRGLLRGDLHTGAHIHGPGAHAASARDGARTRFRGYPVLTRCWMAPIVARVAGGAVQPGVRHQLTERAAARHEGTAGQPAAEPARKAGGTSGGRKGRAVRGGGVLCSGPGRRRSRARVLLIPAGAPIADHEYHAGEQILRRRLLQQRVLCAGRRHLQHRGARRPGPRCAARSLFTISPALGLERDPRAP